MSESRLADVLIFVLGTLDELMLKGYVQRTPDAERLSDEGIKRFVELKAQNFTPDQGELAAAVELFRHIEHEVSEE